MIVSSADTTGAIMHIIWLICVSDSYLVLHGLRCRIQWVLAEPSSRNKISGGRRMEVMLGWWLI